MHIGKYHYSEDQTRAFLYKQRASFLDNLNVFFNRVAELFKHFRWINSETVYQSILGNHPDRQRKITLLNVFEGVSCNTSLFQRVEQISHEIIRENEEIQKTHEKFEREISEKIEKVKSLVKDPEFFSHSIKPIYRLIQLAYKANLSLEEKTFIYAYSKRSLEKDFEAINELQTKLNNLKMLGIEIALDDIEQKYEVEIKSYFNKLHFTFIDFVTADEQLLTEDEKTLLSILKKPLAPKNVESWFSTAKEPSSITNVAASLKHKLENCFDDKVSEKINLVRLKAKSPQEYSENKYAIYKLIKCCFKQDLSEAEKKYIYDYSENEIEDQIHDLNILLENRKVLAKLGIQAGLDETPKSFENHFHINNIFHSHHRKLYELLSDEEKKLLQLTEDEKALVEAMFETTAEKQILKWLEKGKSPDIYSVAASLYKKLKLQVKLDEKMEEWKKIVTAEVDLNSPYGIPPFFSYFISLTDEAKVNIFLTLSTKTDPQQYIIDEACTTKCNKSAKALFEIEFREKIEFVKRLNIINLAKVALREYSDLELPIYQLAKLAGSNRLTPEERKKLIDSPKEHFIHLQKSLRLICIINSILITQTYNYYFKKAIENNNLDDFLQKRICSSIFPTILKFIDGADIEIRNDFDDNQKKIAIILNGFRKNLASNQKLPLIVLKLIESEIENLDNIYEMILSTIVSSHFALSSLLENTPSYNMKKFFDTYVNRQKLELFYTNNFTLESRYIAEFYYGNTTVQAVAAGLGGYVAYTEPFLAPVKEFYLSPNPIVPKINPLPPYFAGALTKFIIHYC